MTTTARADAFIEAQSAFSDDLEAAIDRHMPAMVAALKADGRNNREDRTRAVAVPLVYQLVETVVPGLVADRPQEDSRAIVRAVADLTAEVVEAVLLNGTEEDPINLAGSGPMEIAPRESEQ